jgi:hypothetical protein
MDYLDIILAIIGPIPLFEPLMRPIKYVEGGLAVEFLDGDA